MLYMSSSSSNAFKSTGSSNVLSICVPPSSISRATGPSADIMLQAMLSVLKQRKRDLCLTCVYTQQRTSFPMLPMSSRIASLNTTGSGLFRIRYGGVKDDSTWIMAFRQLQMGAMRQ